MLNFVFGTCLQSSWWAAEHMPCIPHATLPLDRQRRLDAALRSRWLQGFRKAHRPAGCYMSQDAGLSDVCKSSQVSAVGPAPLLRKARPTQWASMFRVWVKFDDRLPGTWKWLKKLRMQQFSTTEWSICRSRRSGEVGLQEAGAELLYFFKAQPPTPWMLGVCECNLISCLCSSQPPMWTWMTVAALAQSCIITL